MWIVFGMRAKAPEGDPYPVDPARGAKKLGYNTDVILNRQGEMVGYYRKSWPCCPSPVAISAWRSRLLAFVIRPIGISMS